MSPELARRWYRFWPLAWLERHLRGGDALVLHDDPLILYVPDWVLAHDDGALLPVFRRYRRRRVHLLVAFSWTQEQPGQIARLLVRSRRHVRRHANHQLVFLANTEAERLALERAGLDAALVHQNAFVDADIFRPLAGVDKRFDAIYDARVDAFKRHALAAGIASLALVTARNMDYHDPAYAASVRKLLARAHWYNDPLAADYRSFSMAEINACLNECRVGLCLSAAEGAMYASAQYLLAGLPVVSTASLGGRDVLFDPAWTRVVADDARAIAAAVDELAALEIPAETIRAGTLARMRVHRDNLYTLLDRIVTDAAGRSALRARWPDWRASQLKGDIDPAGMLARIERLAPAAVRPR